MANQIIPEKIHLNQIHWIVQNTVILEKKLVKNPTYDFKMAHNVMHNLEKGIVKIRLFIDINGAINDKVINQGGNYEVDFLFQIDDLNDQYEIVEDKPVFSGLFVSTLLAISYSTLRGMFFEIWKETVLHGIILPVISVPDLFRSKR